MSAGLRMSHPFYGFFVPVGHNFHIVRHKLSKVGHKQVVLGHKSKIQDVYCGIRSLSNTMFHSSANAGSGPELVEVNE
ncbi:hypothetical protein [Planococcus shenhongbingii]|uniref:Uncharacterized protein n=1 Tax=Planococcus shenhongbingii TaxID=3058398 RepID=A0ABT8NE31_9BACL|nr:hypothetical protein [Planococcus sp. N017]MDN7246137.1 hypothetical protein [Planococcus sp. N017]